MKSKHWDETIKSLLGTQSWGGLAGLVTLHSSLSKSGQGAILKSMRRILRSATRSSDESDWKLAANMIYVIPSLPGATKVFASAVREIKSSEAPTDASRKAIQRCICGFAAAVRGGIA